MSTTLRLVFKEADYIFVHGKKPRGPGVWSFEISNTRSCLHIDSTTYPQAKKRLKDELKNLGVTGIICVTVLS